MEQWFSVALQEWYGRFKRDLPWRNERDPYRIWLSEVILQQTQVAQGLSYYQRFTEVFPTVKDLAKAPEDQVLKLWQGLGYYSRARNLHASAKTIVNLHQGRFPSAYKEIRALKGVGDYTAAAIASFAFDLPYAVVDGNVYRVLARVFGINAAIDSVAGKKQFAQLAASLLDKKRPANHNQAIMEFGSQHCRPVNPGCETCIFREKCVAFNRGRIAVLPAKTKKVSARSRYFHYLVISDKEKRVLVNKRGAGDIWQGLYEFKLFETPEALAPEDFLRQTKVKKLLGNKTGIKYVSAVYKHLLTHQHLHARFYVLALNRRFKPGEHSAPPEELHRYAFPRLIEKFMLDCDLEEIL